ncbi:MAG TPA: hypothetical protein VGQ76_14915 [Thermoanaerobaculia bacterium]|jgi:hypothetical protein|nr:hypothetical protein [Thermoanaerobaculia bacterium]
MSKSLKNSHLPERAGSRTLLAISLFASMVAFGCTTNRNLGNGSPVVTPGVRTVPTGAAPAGSESQPLPPPMMSSSAAAATMAPFQSRPRVTYLGPAAPASGGSPVVVVAGTELQQPFVRRTINSTIYSPPTEAVTSGAGEPIGGDPAVEAEFLATVGAAVDGRVVEPNPSGQQQ